MPFQVIRNDLTHMEVDMIVNTANPLPVIGSGTDTAIYEAAGAEKLLAARRRIGVIEPGQTYVTPAYALKARYIAHTVGPVNQGREQDVALLKSCYESALLQAKKKRCRSIAFPLMGSGNNGFPQDTALQTAIEAISEFLLSHEMMVYLVVYNAGAVKLSERLFDEIEAYIDDEYVERQQPQVDGRSRLLTLDDTCEALPPSAYMPTFQAVRRDSTFGQFSSFENTGKGAADKSARGKRSLEDLVKQQEETFQQMLLRLIREKGMTNAEAYKKANQSKKLFSKILHNPDYQPSKKTALAFAIALELNLDESRDLLARAGYAFSPSSTFDKIIRYFIENETYSIYAIEVALYDHGLDTLCNYQ